MSVTTSTSRMKMHLEDDRCWKPWTRGCRTQSIIGKHLVHLGQSSCLKVNNDFLLTLVLAALCYQHCTACETLPQRNTSDRDIERRESRGTMLAIRLANKAAIQKISTAYETLQFQIQRESSGCGVGVLWMQETLHVGMMFVWCQKHY